MGRGNSVFEEAFGSIRDIPRNAWVMALFACGTSAVTDLIFWDTGERLSWLWTVPLVTLAAFWFAAVYVTVFGILQICTTWQSFARFSLASFALVLPFGLTLLVLIAAKTLFSADARLSILLGAMVLAFLFSSSSHGQWLNRFPRGLFPQLACLGQRKGIVGRFFSSPLPRRQSTNRTYCQRCRKRITPVKPFL